MSEERLQQEIIMDFNNTYPHLRGCLCYNLNNSIGGYRGNVNKFLGVIKGRSDLSLYLGGVATMIELKTETGTQKPEQKKWQALMEAQGFEYVIVRSLEAWQELAREKIASSLLHKIR